MTRLRRRTYLLAVPLLVLLTIPWWLREAGRFLVQAGAPCQADRVVVLAGDWSGGRILKGAELVRAGYAPKAVVSGPFALYGTNEAELAIRYAGTRGFPPALFVPLHHNSYNTQDEVRAIAHQLRQQGVRRILLVTSDFHTRRAGRLMRETAPDLLACVVAAPDGFYRPDRWWDNRESQKRFLYEWIKTVTSWFGI